jgi:hypothetical protein
MQGTLQDFITHTYEPEVAALKLEVSGLVNNIAIYAPDRPPFRYDV